MYNRPMKAHELKKWREALGLTQRELAEKLYVTKDAVASWETGRRKVPAYLHLAMKQLESPNRRKGKP